MALPLFLVLLNEMEFVAGVLIKIIENHQWFIGMPVFMHSKSTGMIHFYSMLFVNAAHITIMTVCLPVVQKVA